MEIGLENKGNKMRNEHIRVLLVEDNPGDMRLIQEMIREVKNTSINIVCSSSLRSALKSISNGGISVVLLDLGLPDCHGFDTFKKTHALNPKLPIIVLSSLDDEELAVKAVKSGAQDYLVKGQVNGSLIIRSLKYAIERKQIEEKLQQSLEKLHRILEQTVYALASTIERKDKYTSGHQRRVAHLAYYIAEEMGLSKEQKNGIYIAGMLHDIGKISIPAEILSNPSQLSESELNLFKNHSRVGYEILKTIEFPWPVAQIILQHHERIDGSGYPSGLKGNNILLEARILGVADVVEAMTSHRPYRAALGINEALKEILNKKGILYDSKIVDTCVKLFTEKGFKLENL